MLSILLMSAFVVMLAALPVTGENVIDKLKENQKIADFRAENVYENETGKAIGARFRHIPSGFVLDLMRIQSVPQAFIWVNSPPPSDQGEPHTCEHLLLGKGTKGRYVASLEDMSLGGSSAFTMQLQTCYHFQTTAGTDTFFDLLLAKLDAFLHPNFSDEEIRREVANIGYSIDPVDSTLRLEEKGTVYSEMVRSFENPWSNLSRQLGFLMYGHNHPLAYSSGGYPDAIRTMTAEDMRRFISDTYHLNNMGMISAIPDEISLDDFLKKTSKILKEVEPDAKVAEDPATFERRLPPPETSDYGIIEQSYFPSENENDPGMILFAWPPTRDLSPEDEILLDLFVANLAGGETSNLYAKFIDSKTRIMDIGSNRVFGWLDTDLGQPVYIGFSNVERDATEIPTVDSIRAVIQNEIGEISEFKNGSPELSEFNQRAKNRILERRRDLRNMLNTPPGFGYRGSGAGWFFHLKDLQKTSGFRKKLTLDDQYAAVENLLDSGTNFWREYLNKWQLLGVNPFAVAARANPELLSQTENERKQRIQAFIEYLKKEYGTASDMEVLTRFKAEYDARTAEIEDEAKKIAMPKFVENPPMTLDDQLRYRVEKMPGDGPLVVSTFESMTSATAGLAFDMYVTPERYLVYVSALPFLATDVGVVIDGERLAYDEMIEKIRQEILNLNARYSVNYRTERIEFVVKGAGGDLQEAMRAIDWMEAILFNADWSENNLPRIRDAVDLSIKSLRNRTKAAEEAWVNDPASAYWKQTNPLLLSANSFLTKIHSLHRLRWMLKEADSPETEDEFSRFMAALAGYGEQTERADLNHLIDALLEKPGVERPAGANEIMSRFDALSPGAKQLVKDAAGDLEMNLPDIPDNSLGGDWHYLCAEIYSDLRVEPSQVLSDLRDLMGVIRRTDNVRGFLIANSADQKTLIPRLDQLVGKFDRSPSKRQAYKSDQKIIDRLKQRNSGIGRPIYVGLVNPNTRSGVFINTVDCANYETSDRETLLKFLSARLYGGGGAHSMFMKTWGAGLAYSNGLRSNESTGRLIYYAERCPDLAQTMQFVVNELRNSDHDPSLAGYAVAQAFVGDRAGSNYENRGEAIAADLADGVSPEVVSRFRENILKISKERDLADELYSRMEDTYGQVLPGYGPDGRDVPGGIYFIIGPEAQFRLFEDYLHGVEGNEILYRLYPRDFWIIEDQQLPF